MLARTNLPQYLVRKTTSEELLGSSWKQSCQLLIMPGGRDLPYCKELDGPGNKQIRSFVEEGGSYLGICAGAYYGSAYCEFDKGDPNMEVLGPRELAFFPVTARGPVFPGFNYTSNAGAHVAGASVTKEGEETIGPIKEPFSLFYNGGCDFVPRETASSTPYQVLVTYTGECEPHPSPPTPTVTGLPAVIGGSIGEGRVILTGLHFECSPGLLEEHYKNDECISPLLPLLEKSETQQRQVFSACILHLLDQNSKQVAGTCTLI